MITVMANTNIQGRLRIVYVAYEYFRHTGRSLALHSRTLLELLFVFSSTLLEVHY